MSFKKLLTVVIVFIVAADAYCGYNDWLGYANMMSRESITVDGPNAIDSDTFEWVADADPQDPGYYVSFEGSTNPIVYNGMVYVYAGYFEPNEQSGGRDRTQSQIIAYNANSGQQLWSQIIAPSIWSSWSSPAMDTKHNTVLIGSGGADMTYGKVYAIDAVTGAIVWTTELDAFVVNASVCISTDTPKARAFITDCAFDLSGKLYCINLDANEPGNLYNPGEIIWSAALGSLCGSTPAYRNGVVYVATAGDMNSHGNIIAYDAAAGSAVQLWKFTTPDCNGFYGGVVVTKEGYLYAATCGFSGKEEDNSTLFKIACNDGSLVWSAPAQATDCVPVVVGDKIYVAGNYPYGVCRLKAYQDLGTSAVKLWETDSGLSIGGYENQPVYANGKLYVGATSQGSWIYDELYILNVEASPADPNFILAHYTDNACGASRAVTYDSIYALGYDGLFKFYQPALLADIDKNDTVDFRDLSELTADWLFYCPIGVNRADLNLDGKIDFTDFSLLAESWYGELN